MSKLSGLSFHIYLFDYDHDGFTDVMLPNFNSSSVISMRNPGADYWKKFNAAAHNTNKTS